MKNLELKKGSAELLILSLVEDQPRHGYDISRLIEQRSAGTVKFRVASLYPLLYRLEQRGWIDGRWVEKAGQRRRRYYHLTREGHRVLAAQRRDWLAFVEAIQRITGLEHAGGAELERGNRIAPGEPRTAGGAGVRNSGRAGGPLT